MKYHKIPESSIQAELELDWDFLEHSRTYQLFGIIWNNFSQGHDALTYADACSDFGHPSESLRWATLHGIRRGFFLKQKNKQKQNKLT